MASSTCIGTSGERGSTCGGCALAEEDDVVDVEAVFFVVDDRPFVLILTLRPGFFLSPHEMDSSRSSRMPSEYTLAPSNTEFSLASAVTALAMYSSETKRPVRISDLFPPWPSANQTEETHRQPGQPSRRQVRSAS